MNNTYNGHEKVRGVNLGGWLVLERWITPSLFEGTDSGDEYGFMQTPGAGEELDRHRKTFITEKDFKWLSDNGMTTIRIPVGYWLFGNDGPFLASHKYLDWAVETAGRYDLKVLIDLHAVKGSQNGNDHSGRAGVVGWYSDRAYQEETIGVLKRLAHRYRDAPSLWGVELINEPKITPRTFFTLRSFYRAAYRELQEILRPGTHIVFSDAFAPRLLSGVLKGAADYPVVMDAHWYQFGKTDLQSYFGGLARRPEEIERLQRQQPVIVGEWSGMLSHETLAGLADKEKAALEIEHLQRQIEAYASASGWFYWTYKTESEGIWNFRSLVERGVFPLV